jgi:hypothetical protein
VALNNRFALAGYLRQGKVEVVDLAGQISGEARAYSD